MVNSVFQHDFEHIHSDKDTRNNALHGVTNRNKI